MTIGLRLSRRSLLKAAVAAGGCGLGRPLRAKPASEATAAKETVDTHVYLGQWPHAYLTDGEPAALIAMLRRHGISQAWAGSFDGLFYKDVAGVNERLAEVCASTDKKFYVPFGTVNPMLPDWEDDVRRCDEQHHMRGIRLHPNYHGYALDDSRFARLLQLAAERSLVVQLVAALDGAPHRWLAPISRQVDLAPLADVLKKVRDIRVVIAGGASVVNDAVLESFVDSSDAYFEVSGRETNASMWQNRAPARRLVFGSGAPLHTLSEAAFALNTSGPNAANLFPAK
jgi:uncharacterized protein